MRHALNWSDQPNFFFRIFFHQMEQHLGVRLEKIEKNIFRTSQIYIYIYIIDQGEFLRVMFFVNTCSFFAVYGDAYMDYKLQF